MGKLPWSREHGLRIARAFLAEGDIPEQIMLAFREHDEDVGKEILLLREAHFAELGLPVPEYAGDFPR